ncbi:MAG TPA: hypothetical protein VGG85_13200 [Terracidiphilus sp.]|jgi:hypothetical protein
MLNLRWLASTFFAVATLLPVSAMSQSAPASPAAATPQAAADANSLTGCVRLADEAIPLNSTIEAKVAGTMEAAHLKPGKKIWVNAVYGMVYPGCRMEPDAAIYGTVTAASSSKNPNASELSLLFDSIDCAGHAKQSMTLFLIGIIAPPEQSRSSHDAVPTEIQGGSRQISDTVAATDSYDAKLSAGGPPHTVHPGAVVGFKALTLEPQGGPQCSAKMSSSNRNIELGPGTVLVLAPRNAPQ